MKRIRRDPRVELAPCTLRGRPLGPAAAATARVVADPEEEVRAERALEARYGLYRPVVLGVLHLARVRELYLAVAPAATR